MRKGFAAVLLGSMILGNCFSSVPMYAVTTNIGSNLISNGTFDTDIDYWNTYAMLGGVNEISLEDGALKVDIKDSGSQPYSVQVYQTGFTVYQKGKYHLEFDISSSEERTVSYRVQLNSGDYHPYAEASCKIGPKSETVSMDFTMEEATDMAPSLCFNLGKYPGEELGAHDIKIDNVKLYLTDDSEVEYGEEKIERKVAINQVGYKSEEQKIAVFKGEEVGNTFKVIADDTKEVVYEGQIYGRTYNEATHETDSFGNFTDLTTPGKYYVVINDGEEENTSYTFTIGEDIYNDVFKDAVRFFYLQRCGAEIPSELGGTWAHPECHTELARIYGTDEKVDVSGGWHDAGDYGRYVVASATAVADLLYAYEDNEAVFGDDFNIPESGNGVPDVLDEIRYQLEWFFKMQDPASGGVYHKVTCANFPGYIMPEEEKDELIICPISTTATGDFAAVMAMGYEHFKEIDSAFANKCLEAAKKAWNYLEQAPSGCFTNPEGIVTGEYIDDNDSDERYWAAAQLFRATGDPKYKEAFGGLIADGIKLGYGWNDVGSFGNKAYLTAEGADGNIVKNIENYIINEANNLVALAKNDGYGVAKGIDYYWGSNMGVMNNAILLAEANKILPNPEYINYAREHLNYCFGKNSLVFSYVTGYGKECAASPHHRPSIATHTAIPGMLVGGPNKKLEDPLVQAYKRGEAPARCYLDHYESYSTNEVDIYWNSPFVYALAQLEMK